MKRPDRDHPKRRYIVQHRKGECSDAYCCQAVIDTETGKVRGTFYDRRTAESCADVLNSGQFDFFRPAPEDRGDVLDPAVSDARR